MLFHVWHISKPFHRGMYLAQNVCSIWSWKHTYLFVFDFDPEPAKTTKASILEADTVHLVLNSDCVRLLAFPESRFWSVPRECLISLAWHLPSQCISASFSNNMDHMFSVESHWRRAERPGSSLIGLNNELIWLKAFNAHLSLKMRNRLRISPFL